MTLHHSSFRAAWLTGRIAAGLALAGCVGLATAARAQGVPVPPVHAHTLAGGAVDLPAQGNASASVLVFGFSKASTDQVAQWGRRLADDASRPAALSYYEVAVLQDVPKLLRGFVERQIKGSVSARAQTHFFTLFDHEAEWKQALHFKKPDDAYVAVLDSTGRLAWQTEGAVSDASYAELKRHLADVQAAK